MHPTTTNKNLGRTLRLWAGTSDFRYLRYFVSQEKAVVKIGYFVVDPTLYLKKEKTLSFDAICCQTVLSKNLGLFSGWKKKLRVSKETGYNMIHFTPVQHLGGSQSAYSIADQLHSNPNFRISRSPVLKKVKTSGRLGDVGRVPEMEEGLKRIGDFVEHLRSEWEMLSITDVVWNHTSNDTPWLKDHPEAGFNLLNSPHLRPAFALDQEIYKFSCQIGDGKWETEGIPPLVRTEDELHQIVRTLHHKIIPEIRLWEYFTVDCDKLVDEFKMILSGKSAPLPDHPDRESLQLNVIQDVQYRRHGSTVDMDVAVKMFKITILPCIEKSSAYVPIYSSVLN